MSHYKKILDNLVKKFKYKTIRTGKDITIIPET